jgi:arginine exporter protein ArgO
MLAIDYFKYVSYALIAIGLINLQYQQGQDNVLLISSLVISGIILFTLTLVKVFRELSRKKSFQIIIAIVVTALITLAILN